MSKAKILSQLFMTDLFDVKLLKTQVFSILETNDHYCLEVKPLSCTTPETSHQGPDHTHFPSHRISKELARAIISVVK